MKHSIRPDTTAGGPKRPTGDLVPLGSWHWLRVTSVKKDDDPDLEESEDWESEDEGNLCERRKT